jgi:hypothetical protein
MKFVEDIKDAWKWFSVQLMAAAFIWETLPEDIKGQILVVIPDPVEPYITSSLVLAAIVGRVIKQGKENAENYTQ